MPSIGGAYSLRVMSYNIRADRKSDGINRWAIRKYNVFNLIRNRAPDVFGIQQVLRNQVYSLRDALPNYRHYGVGEQNGREGGEFAPIFYRADRFDLLDHGTFWLSKTPHIPGSEGWDARGPRICSWVKLHDRQASQTFYYFNTHFDSTGRTARLESARLILSQIKVITGYSTPIILAGDFNSSPNSEVYQTFITNTIFSDSKYLSERSHCGPYSTFSTFFVGDPVIKCIDHIFVTSEDFKVLQHATLTDSNNGYYPSDHLPVLAEIAWKKLISD